MHHKKSFPSWSVIHINPAHNAGPKWLLARAPPPLQDWRSDAAGVTREVGARVANVKFGNKVWQDRRRGEGIRSGRNPFLFVEAAAYRRHERVEDVALGDGVDWTVPTRPEQPAMELKLNPKPEHGGIRMEKEKLRVSLITVDIVLKMSGKFRGQKVKKYFLDSVARHGEHPYMCGTKEFPTGGDGHADDSEFKITCQ